MRRKFLILSFQVLILVSLFAPQEAFAKSACDENKGSQDCINELEQKVSTARSQINSLSSQINLISTKIELGKVRLAKTHADIENTQKEIEELGTKIEKLNSALDHLSGILLEKIVEGYKNRQTSFLDVFFSPKATTLENQLKYIRVAQENDRVLAIKTQQVKVNFSEQKDLRETKVVELEELENQLEIQKSELDNQVIQKESLLTQTKGDEKKYQQQLSQALAEFQAISQAVQSGKKVGPVKKGDPIALVGNTGFPYCSTGAHLHLEARKGGTWVDPGNYIGKDWKMPLSEPVTITQGYGVTPWSWRYSYSGGIHTGWDMVSSGSDVIRAVDDGDLYSSSQNCSGAIIKIRYIDHGDGLMSFYLHVQ